MYFVGLVEGSGVFKGFEDGFGGFGSVLGLVFELLEEAFLEKCESEGS
jgi:hypothetical protein